MIVIISILFIKLFSVPRVKKAQVDYKHMLFNDCRQIAYLIEVSKDVETVSIWSQMVSSLRRRYHSKIPYKTVSAEMSFLHAKLLNKKHQLLSNG